MKKLFVLTLICLAAVCRMNGTNQISIPDVYVQNGGTATFAVNYEYETANSIQLFGFDLELPEGLTFTTDCLMDNANQGFSLQSNTSGSTVSIAFQPAESGTVLSGTSGTVAYLSLKAASTLIAGTELTVYVKNVAVVVDDGTGKDVSIDLPETSFKVAVGDRILLDENSTKAPSNKSNVNVRVNRTINAGKWSTLCLPFTMSEEQVAAAFGDDVQLAEFVGAEFVEDGGDIVEIIMNFEEVSVVTQARPCIIKVSSPISFFVADGVTVKNSSSPSYDATNGSFNGTYKAGTSIDEDNLFISGGKFLYSPEVGVTTKAFRGFFMLDKVLTDKTATARIGLNVGGDVTYINSLGAEINDDIYYDLQGRRVNNPGKGVYIQNGKKVFVK